jgi:hypothetical protein
MHTTFNAPAVQPFSSPGIPSGLAAPHATYSSARRHTTIDGVTYKVADCRADREAAFRLVYDAYVATGLMEPNLHGMRVTPYHLLPTTDVFLAVHQGQLVYTMTLVRDGELGLPVDKLYPVEVESRRHAGVHLAEASCLAACHGRLSRSFMFNVLVNLQAILVQSARANGVDRIVLAVHPRHSKFYQRQLGFEQIGDEKPYASVLDNPAVLIEHEFTRAVELGFPLCEALYRVPFAPWELSPQSMPAREREEAAEIAARCGAFVPVRMA